MWLVRVFLCREIHAPSMLWPYLYSVSSFLKSRKKKETSMLRIFLSVLFVGSFAGIIRAQQTTGAKAEEAKKDIIRLEDEKVGGLLRGGADPLDWLKKYDADDVIGTDVDGKTLESKAIAVAKTEKGVTVLSMIQRDDNMRVYGNGTTVVITYRGCGNVERFGKVTAEHLQFADVWAKQDNGAWLRVVHWYKGKGTPVDVEGQGCSKEMQSK
jgi:hypothetical protein